VLTGLTLDTSDEAKQHSREELEKLGGENAFYGQDKQGSDAPDANIGNPGNILGGHKATLSNPSESHAQIALFSTWKADRNRFFGRGQGEQQADTEGGWRERIGYASLAHCDSTKQSVGIYGTIACTKVFLPQAITTGLRIEVVVLPWSPHALYCSRSPNELHEG